MTVTRLDESSAALLHAHPDAALSKAAESLSEWTVEMVQDFLASLSLGIHVREVAPALEQAYDRASVDNWDGYGAKPISPESYWRAHDFLQLLPSTVPPPDVSAEPDGEIAFEWHVDPSHTFSVSVGRDGRLSFAAILGRNESYGTEYLVDRMPEPVLSILRRLLANG
jgi:hypothetical protein